MANLKDSFLENKVFNPEELPIVYFSDNTDKQLQKKQFVKNITGKYNTILSDCFYSEENIEIINKQLILAVFNKTNSKYKICNQKRENILIIMTFIWENYSRNLDYDITNQIRKLNRMVVNEMLPKVLTNLEQQYEYIENYDRIENNNINLLDLPINAKLNRGTTELQSMTNIFD